MVPNTWLSKIFPQHFRNKINWCWTSHATAKLICEINNQTSTFSMKNHQHFLCCPLWQNFILDVTDTKVTR